MVFDYKNAKDGIPMSWFIHHSNISVYLLNRINPVEFTLPCTLIVMSVAV